MNGPLAVDTYQLLSCFADLEPKIAFSRVRKRSYCNCVFAIGPCQNRPARPAVKAAAAAAAAGPSCTVARGPDLRLLVFRTSTFCTAASLARHCTAKLHTTRWLSTAVQLLRKKMQNCIGRGSRRRRQRRRWRQLARPTVARGPDLRLLVFRTSTFCTAASLGIVLQNFILRVGYQLCNCCEKNAKLHRARQSTAAANPRSKSHVPQST